VWVARVYQNRVEFRMPDGTKVRGAALPDRVLEVTRADRELFIRSFPPELRRTAEQLPFAPIKPPFETGFTSADGMVWLQKTKAAFDTTGRYHVVDSRGELTREVRVPTTSRILAAAGDRALAVEADSGGLRLLQYTVPPLQTVQGSP
jgi:sugar lactone lactonase YvrE